MNEPDRDNQTSPADDHSSITADDVVPDDSWPVCPNCFKPVNPLRYYCDNCDSNEAVNPLASYMPFVRIRFACGIFGKMWRKIWHDKDTSIPVRLLCLLMILLFAPVMLVFGLPFVLTAKIKNPALRKAATIILCLLAFFLLLFLVPLSRF